MPLLSGVTPQLLPIIPWVLIQAVSGLTTGLTEADSPLRPAAVAIIVALGCAVQMTVTTPTTVGAMEGVLAAMGWVNVLNAIDLLLLSRISYGKQIEWEVKAIGENESIEKGKRDSSKSLFKRISWSFNIAFNYRRIDTQWQIANIPSFDHSSRLAFLGRRGLEVLVGFVMMQFFTLETDYDGIAEAMSAISRTKHIPVPWSAFSLRNFLYQTSFSLSFLLLARAAIVIPYNLASIVTVAVGFSKPASWPPISGYLTEATSIREFWRSVWHQSLRKPLVESTDFLIYSILRFPRGMLSACYLRMLLVFTASGVIHALMDLGLAITLDQSGGVWFFTLQAPAIIIEIFFQRLFPASRANTLLNRIFGTIWVAAVLAWTAPIWIDPMIWRFYDFGIRVPTPLLFVGGHSFLK